MDTSIDNLIQCISDSMKRKDEEIANLKLEIKNFESVLEISEKRARKLEEEIKKSECENSALREKLKNSKAVTTHVHNSLKKFLGNFHRNFLLTILKCL